MRNILLVSLNILLQLVLINISFAYSINEWKPYLSCNNGATVVDYKTILNSRSEQDILQVVVKDRGVVDFFKERVPGLYKLDDVFYQRRNLVYNDKGEAIFPATVDYNGKSRDNINKFGPRSLYSSFKTENSGQADFIAERIGSGLKVQLQNHEDHKEIVNWYFESCHRVNNQGSFDPLDFYYAR